MGTGNKLAPLCKGHGYRKQASKGHIFRKQPRKGHGYRKQARQGHGYRKRAASPSMRCREWAHQEANWHSLEDGDAVQGHREQLGAQRQAVCGRGWGPALVQHIRLVHQRVRHHLQAKLLA